MLKPIGPRVLVKRIDEPRPQSELIIVPDVVESEASAFAIVLAVGTKVTEDINVADTVVLSKYAGAPVTVELDGERLEAIIVMQDDVLGIVKEN
jgi:chaperonin GroES